MYKWLKEYVKTFGADFPFSKVAYFSEYEIIRIIQYCIKTDTAYTDESIVEKALVDKAKADEAEIND